MSSRFFYFFIFLSLALSILVSVALVGKRAESSVFTLIEQANSSKAELANNHLEQFLNARISILNDLSEAPVLINGVLGSEYSNANLSDYLSGYKILGRKEDIVIYDINGDSVYSSANVSNSSVVDESWFLDLVNQTTKVAISTVEIDGGHTVTIYVPVIFRGSAEGVLEVNFEQKLEELLSSVMTSLSAIQIRNSYFSYSSLIGDKRYTQILDSPVGSTGLRLQYFVDSEVVDDKKSEFMTDIGLAIILSLSISFFVLSIFGRKYFLNPYLSLARSRLEIKKEKEKNDLLAQAIEESTVGITISEGGDDFPITYVNKAFTRITGYSSDEIIGNNCRFLQGGSTDPSVVDRISKAILHREKIRVEVLNYKKDGTEFWNDLRLSPVLNSEGVLLAYVGVQQDISEAKVSQKSLMKARDDAQAAVIAKSEFLANMSHEIRTPMNGVLGMLGLVLNDDLDLIQKRRLEIAQNSAKSLLTLINDILDLSKIEADKLDLEKIGFNVRTLIGEVGEVMALSAEGKNVELILNLIGIDTPVVVGDPGRIRQVLTNLVGNAIKFTELGEVVIRAELKTSPSDGSVKLLCSVLDTGIGISDEKIATLFDAFNQVDASTTRKYGGTGLGLSIAKKLCTIMDGNISVTSELGTGSIFSFEVPVEKAEHSKTIIPLVDMTKLNILIVDDNDVNREVLRGQLEHWGATIFEASSGRNALLLCEQHCSDKGGPCFDIAFLDMQMPEMDGMELGRQIMANDCFGDIRLIMMTSMGYRGDSHKFAELGFSGYFPKPITTLDLFNALNIIAESGSVLERAAPILTEQYLKYRNNSDDHQGLENAKILLVEDNDINRLVVEGILEGVGPTLVMAKNGQEALSLMQCCDVSEPYTLIIMDCQMPVMDGYEATKNIREGNAGHHYINIPIIAITANAMDGDRKVCVDAGMSDYVSKPIDSNLLINKLKQWSTAVDLDAEGVIKASLVGGIVPSPEEKNWDYPGLLARVGGNEVVIHRLINVYLTDSNDMLLSIATAIQSHDHDSLKTASHLLKGVAGNLGAVALLGAVQQLEKAATHALEDQYEVLFKETKECNRALLKLFVQYVTPN